MDRALMVITITISHSIKGGQLNQNSLQQE
jgi:hypothetical protein